VLPSRPNRSSGPDLWQNRGVRAHQVVPVVVVAVAAALCLGPVAAGAAAVDRAPQDQGGNGKKPTLNQDQQAQAKHTAAYAKTARLAIADIQSYWAATFPDVYGAKYQAIPSNRIFAAHPGVKLPPCQGQRLSYRDAENNAFYCFKTNYVAYDDVKLFPDLFQNFGDFSIALVFAHEWGHAIQDRSDNADQPSIVKELQADCFAGSWTRHVADGDSRTLKLEPGSLDSALAAYLKRFRDAPGSSPQDASAHGDAFDRVSAFGDGYQNGAQQCATYFDTPPLTTEQQFSNRTDANSGGNLPADEVIPVTVDLLNDFYRQVEPNYTPLTIDNVVKFNSAGSKSQLPKCGGSVPPRSHLTNRVFYCIDDGYLAFDEPYVQHVYDDIGDFGVTTLFANTWATYVQLAQQFPGAADNTDNAVLAADCYSGGFAAAMWNGYLKSDTLGDSVSLSSGDLDETVAALLDYVSARGISQSGDVTFSLFNAFKGGFFDGYGSCVKYRPSG
jgi:predicted metalloprotease